MGTRVDATGLSCPWPVLKLQKALSELAAGDEVELHATDPLARVDVPHYCQQSGHIFKGEEEPLVGRSTAFCLHRDPSISMFCTSTEKPTSSAFGDAVSPVTRSKMGRFIRAT